MTKRRNIFKKEISKKNQLKIIMLSIFLMMLILNLLTPLLADDFSYSFGLDGRINNIMDIIENQINHYLTWGGRTIAHTLAQIFLMIPKIIFSVCNTMVYTLLIWLIYQHSKTDKEEKPILLILIHLALWFFLPVFGQTCLWLIGSCNYLWTMVLMLIFLLLYRKNYQVSKNKFMAIGMFLFGIIVGWTNENTAFGLITIISTMLILRKIENKKEKYQKWEISGLIGAIVGFIILIVAPGNYVRNEVFKDDTFILIKLFKRAIEDTVVAIDYLLPLIIIIVVLSTILIYNKKKIKNEMYVFLIGAFFTIYSMVLSPTFPERAWFGVFVFTIIAMTIELSQLNNFSKIYKFLVIDIVIILSIVYTQQYITTAVDINKLRNTWEEREKIITEAKKNKQENVELAPYVTINSKNPAYGLADIGPEYDKWPNDSIAKYYGVKRIIQKQE